MSPLIDIDLGLTQPRYRAYPVVDHIADKLTRCWRHIGARARYLPARGVSRSRRSGDLRPLRARSTAKLSHSLFAPRPAAATSSYPATCPILQAPIGRLATHERCAMHRASPDRDLKAALRTVRSLLDPLLGGKVVRRWDPNTLSWSRSGMPLQRMAVTQTTWSTRSAPSQRPAATAPAQAAASRSPRASSTRCLWVW